MPAFITGPGETDVLMVVTAVILGLSVVGFGILYFRLHALPEHMAHKGQKVQFEIVALLALIALFTHNHIFWIAALLLAFIDLPDFGGFLGRIAGSVERMAGVKPGRGADEGPIEVGGAREVELEPQRAVASAAAPQPKRPMTRGKELDHA
jgi:hypothetical protein